jgi:phosphatidylglycerophosphate synthase
MTTADLARPLQIEDPSNRWVIHPAAMRLLPGALRLGIHPNLVSFAGLGLGILAGICYWHWRDPLAVIAGFLLMTGWHVMDGLDGKLARASGKDSAVGRLIDGVCDYLVFFIVLIPIALTFPDWGRTLALCLFAGFCHAVQAGWYEGEREAWKRRAAGLFRPQPRPSAWSVAEAGHNWLEARLGNSERPIDAALAARPERLPAYLAATAPWLRIASIADANNRTIGIALACLIGEPRLFWLWEIFGITAAALIIARRLRRIEAEIAGNPRLSP